MHGPPNFTKRRPLVHAAVFSLALVTSIAVPRAPAAATSPPPPFRGQTDALARGTPRSATSPPQLRVDVTESRNTARTPKATGAKATTTARARKAARARNAARARPGARARKMAGAATKPRDVVSIPLPAPPTTPRQVSIGFRVDLHGFSFANWTNTDPGDDAGPPTLRRLFGDASVCAAVIDNTCQPFERVPLFLERLNAELDKGRCEGMVLLAFERFRSGATDTPTLALHAVIQDLNYWSTTQILPRARERARESRGWDVTRIVAELGDDLQRGGGSILGLFDNDMAHSVLPLSLDVHDGVAKVGLYDPNHPLVPQTLIINLAERSWWYDSLNADGSVAMKWAGPATGGLSLVPISLRGSAETNYFKP